MHSYIHPEGQPQLKASRLVPYMPLYHHEHYKYVPTENDTGWCRPVKRVKVPLSHRKLSFDFWAEVRPMVTVILTMGIMCFLIWCPLHLAPRDSRIHAWALAGNQAIAPWQPPCLTGLRSIVPPHFPLKCKAAEIYKHTAIEGFSCQRLYFLFNSAGQHKDKKYKSKMSLRSLIIKGFKKAQTHTHTHRRITGCFWSPFNLCTCHMENKSKKLHGPKPGVMEQGFPPSVYASLSTVLS